MSGMAGVLAKHRLSSLRTGSHAGGPHMPDIGVYEQRCHSCGPIKETQSDHQAAMLSAAGYGPIRAAAAAGWDAAVSRMTYEDGTPVEVAQNVNPYR